MPLTSWSGADHRQRGPAWYRRLEARVALAVCLLVAGSLGAVLTVTTRTIKTRSLERASTDLEAARIAFSNLADDRAGFASAQAALVAALPVFRAHLTDARLSGDLPTLEALASEYRRQLKADFIIVGDASGDRVALAGWPAGGDVAADLRPVTTPSTAGAPARAFAPVGDRLFLVVSEPALFADEVLGTLTVGYVLDDAVATRLAAETNCAVNIAAGGVLYASSLADGDRAALASLITTDRLPQSGVVRQVTRVGTGDYVVGTFPLSSNEPGPGRLVLLQDWRPTAQFVNEIRRRVLLAGAGALAIAIAAGIVFSRRMSHPLRDLAQAATEIAAGNWERRVPVRGTVEATMTAEAFNAMTTSLRHWYEEAKKRDDELRLAQKLEAVGRLAGGIAHDFNNLLMAIRGYAELLLGSLTGDPRREDVDEIINAADRAAALTKQLLTFSRRQAVQPQVLAIDRLVGRAEQMLRQVVSRNIELSVVVPKGISAVRGDASQLEQVILNLSVNARDAMPDGGRLRVELANVRFDDAPQIAATPGVAAVRRPPTLPPGPYVRLSVTDTGTGMSAETVARIFEPFFTTKEDGRGTGLGLAMVYAIVDQGGGAIDVVTAVNAGTTFHVYLPASPDAELAAEPPADAGPKVRPRGSETVLLVEDEKHLATFIGGALRAHGYTVLQATNGKEALEIVRTTDAAIHLLLTDVVLPGMGGRELSEVVTSTRSETRVLFMSGYPDDAIMRLGIGTPSAHFLQKPFSIAALTVKIREALL